MLLCTLLLASLVDLTLTPAVQTGDAGDVFSIDLVASSVDPASVAAIDAVLSWDPSQLKLLGVDPNSIWFVAGFFNDPDGINLLTNDGDALYTVLSSPGAAVDLPPDLVVASFSFQLLSTGELTLLPELGAFGETRVVSSTPGLEITGELPDPACLGIPGFWTDLGNGLAGTGGLTPQLTGSGLLTCQDDTTFDLVDAQPGVLAYFVIGITEINAPFKGGVLVPAPDLVTVFAVPPGGAASFSFPWPVGIPGGISLAYQYWFNDPGGPLGFSASNAIRSTTG